MPAHKLRTLRVDSPFSHTIVLFENWPFPWLSGGFLERRIPGKNGEGSTRTLGKDNPGLKSCSAFQLVDIQMCKSMEQVSRFDSLPVFLPRHAGRITAETSRFANV